MGLGEHGEALDEVSEALLEDLDISAEEVWVDKLAGLGDLGDDLVVSTGFEIFFGCLVGGVEVVKSLLGAIKIDSLVLVSVTFEAFYLHVDEITQFRCGINDLTSSPLRAGGCLLGDIMLEVQSLLRALIELRQLTSLCGFAVEFFVTRVFMS